MKGYITSQLRNVGLVSHGGAGKTTLLEAMLFTSGAITRMGRVEDGNTTSTTIVPVEWNGLKLNILDTPGYGDFIGEVKSAIRIIDGALFVLCGVAGIEVQTQVIWELAQATNLPRAFYINKLDRENANFLRVVEQLSDYLGNSMVVCQLPIGSESDFQGIVDVLKEKAYYFEAKGKGREGEIPGELAEQVNYWRNKLIEAAVENDEEIMIKYLDGQDITLEEIQKALQIGINLGNIFPVLCGSAVNNRGVSTLMDWLGEYFSAPKAKDMGTQLIIFKTIADPFIGKLSYAKVTGGTLKADSSLYNLNKRKKEKIGQLLMVRGKTQTPTQEVVPGDLVAIPKLQETSTGDTLSILEDDTALPGIEFPEPTLAIAIEPKSKGDEDKLSHALARLQEEDPTVIVEKNIETKETILRVMGDMHLDIILERFLRKYGVEVTGKTPKVPYRETIQGLVKVEGKHKKQSGGHGQYGHVWLEIQPDSQVELEFSEKIFGGSVPKQYIPAVEKGVREAMQEGVLAGFPVTGVRVILYDGSYHSVDSSELAFKIAASQAFKKGIALAKPVLLEPVMNLEITVTENYMGDIISDLNGKRGRVLGIEPNGKLQAIKAQAPLGEILRYTIDLKALTQGRAKYTMSFAQYEMVPPKLSDQIIAENKGK